MPQKGRTSAMIRGLPDAGAVIVVPSTHTGRVISDMVLELRGPDVDKRCRIVAIADETDLEQLVDCRELVVFDHTFAVMTPRWLADEAHALARAANARASISGT